MTKDWLKERGLKGVREIIGKNYNKTSFARF